MGASAKLSVLLSFKAQCLPQIEEYWCLAECHVVAQTQGYHLVCVWGSLVKFQGGGIVLKNMLCAKVWICCVLDRCLPLSFKAQCLPQIEERLCLAGCRVVAQTQGYHLVCVWGSLVKFQGGGLFVKFDVFSHRFAVCLCCLHTSNDPLCW